MGIRETQFFGLSEKAHKFLESNAKRTPAKTCPTCKHKRGGDMIRTEYADRSDLGMFDDGPKLYEYKLKDGSVAKEVVQSSTWSSGPCIFLCLEIGGKKKFKWPENVIRNA